MELIELKNIKDELRQSAWIYDNLNKIRETNDVCGQMDAFLYDFLRSDFSLSLHTTLLMGTFFRKCEQIKINRDKIWLRAEQLAITFCKEKGLNEEQIKKEVDFLLKGLR